MYSGVLASQLRDARRDHFNRVSDDDLRRAVLFAFFLAVVEFDLDSPESASLFGGEGSRPLLFRFPPAVRQEVTDATMPVQFDGRRVTDAFQRVVRTEPRDISGVKPSVNIGVLLDSMGETVELCGMVFTREQITDASVEADAQRVDFLKYDRFGPGEIYDWAFGDLPKNDIERMMNRITIVEADRVDAADNDLDAGYVASHLVDHDPLGDARADALFNRDRVELILRRMSDSQVELLSALFGLDDDAPMTQEEYAAAKGVSQQAVSKALLSALKEARYVG
jgi:hypothetical protein